MQPERHLQYIVAFCATTIDESIFAIWGRTAIRTVDTIFVGKPHGHIPEAAYGRIGIEPWMPGLGNHDQLDRHGKIEDLKTEESRRRLTQPTRYGSDHLRPGCCDQRRIESRYDQ